MKRADDIPAEIYSRVINAVLAGDRQATAFLDKNLTVKATRRGKFDRRDNQEIILVTVGAPNYAERAIIKKYLKSGGEFPIDELLVRPYPAKRK